MTAQEQVRDGAQVLDELVPNWHERVKPHLINIERADNCILGQVFGSFGKGCDAIYNSNSAHAVWLLGFCAPTARESEELGEAWKQEIALRRALDDIDERAKQKVRYGFKREEALV